MANLQLFWIHCKYFASMCPSISQFWCFYCWYSFPKSTFRHGIWTAADSSATSCWEPNPRRWDLYSFRSLRLLELESPDWVSSDHWCCCPVENTQYFICEWGSRHFLGMSREPRFMKCLWQCDIRTRQIRGPGMLEIQQLDKTAVKAELKFQTLQCCREPNSEEWALSERVPL